MSSIESNKLFGAVLLGGLIAMVTGFVADQLVSPEEIEEHAYPVVVAEAPPAGGAAPAEPVGPEPIAPLLAAADPAAGQRVARPCQACHSFDPGGANKVGPALYGIVGADIAAVEGYSYSADLAAAPGVWDYEALNAFLYDPKAYVPGTKMTFAGVKDTEDRAALIAWMRTLHDDPPPLPQ